VILVADTSGLIAASDKNSPESADCQAALAEAGTVLVSPLVLTEVDHLARARFGSDALSALIDFIVLQARRERFHVPEITVDLLEAARKVQRKYAGLDLDLADGVNVALAAEYRTCCVLTLDRRDFRAIRPLTPHPAFRLLPDDR
jgi:predicted nucleic acid-binding protein